jgi:hypothetical protein
VVTNDNKILPFFEFYNRKLLASGVDRLPDVDLKPKDKFYLVYIFAFNISKGPSENSITLLQFIKKLLWIR